MLKRGSYRFSNDGQGLWETDGSSEGLGCPGGFAEQGIYAVVNNRWKYAYSAGDDREFLFDRRHDPMETQNVADLPLTDASQAAMKRILIEHLRGIGESSAIEGKGWRRYPDWKPPASPIVGQRVYDHPWADLHIPGYSEA